MTKKKSTLLQFKLAYERFKKFADEKAREELLSEVYVSVQCFCKKYRTQRGMKEQDFPNLEAQAMIEIIRTKLYDRANNARHLFNLIKRRVNFVGAEFFRSKFHRSSDALFTKRKNPKCQEGETEKCMQHSINEIDHDQHLTKNHDFSCIDSNDFMEWSTRLLVGQQREVFTLYFLEKLTLKQVGRRIKRSESRVCQILQEALSCIEPKIRKALGREDYS